MTTVREPLLRPIPIASLKPTQITVGFREVKEKQKRWRGQGGEKKSSFLGRHMIRRIVITSLIIITSPERFSARVSNTSWSRW